MKTLIELYDERPLENVLGTEMFRPDCTVFISPSEIVRSRSLQNKLRKYFRRRRISTKIVFTEADIFSSTDLLEKLKDTATKYPECAVDITGGTDAALFASGLFCANSSIPVFTYSRKRNMFFNIQNAPFADNVVCNIKYDVEDFFLMAGGAMRTGRVDNSILSEYLDLIDPFFALYMRYRRDWPDIITYMQRVSPSAQNGEKTPLYVYGSYNVKGERGARIAANEDALRDMEDIGLIRGLEIEKEAGVEFTYKDAQVRAWLRDVGSVLELYIYKACLETGLYQDVRTSAIGDWERGFSQNNVTNELDVMAACGVMPVFISCKTCNVKTEALNELAVLRDRFGGQSARAAIVTAENGNAIMRHRASELDIDVIDIRDLRSGTFRAHLKALAKAR